MNRVLLPEGWPRPKGYSNGIAAESLPAENSMTGRAHWATVSRMIWMDSASSWSR